MFWVGEKRIDLYGLVQHLLFSRVAVLSHSPNFLVEVFRPLCSAVLVFDNTVYLGNIRCICRVNFYTLKNFTACCSNSIDCPRFGLSTIIISNDFKIIIYMPISRQSLNIQRAYKSTNYNPHFNRQNCKFWLQDKCAITQRELTKDWK